MLAKFTPFKGASRRADARQEPEPIENASREEKPAQGKSEPETRESPNKGRGAGGTWWTDRNGSRREPAREHEDGTRLAKIGKGIRENGATLARIWSASRPGREEQAAAHHSIVGIHKIEQLLRRKKLLFADEIA